MRWPALFAVMGGCAALTGVGDYVDGPGDAGAARDGATDASIADGARSAYADAVLADRPLSYYRLGETGGTVAKDLGSAAAAARYGAEVMLGAPGLLAGDSDRAAAFQAGGGFGALVIVPSNPSLEPKTQLTVECWTRATHYGDQRIVSYGSDAQAQGYEAWVLQATNGRLAFYSGTLGELVGTTALGDLTVHHLVATYDGTQMALFLDGVREATRAVSGVIGRYDGVNGLAIGGGFSGTGVQMIGVVDEVAIYGAALAASRIEAHFAAGH